MMCCECVFTKTPHALHYLGDEINLVCHVGRSIAHTRDSMNKESISLYIRIFAFDFLHVSCGWVLFAFFLCNCHFLFVACYIAIFTRTLYYTCWLCRTINKLTCDGISHLYALYYNMYMYNTIILYMHATKQRIKYKMIHRYMYTKWLYGKHDKNSKIICSPESVEYWKQFQSPRMCAAWVAARSTTAATTLFAFDYFTASICIHTSIYLYNWILGIN